MSKLFPLVLVALPLGAQAAVYTGNPTAEVSAWHTVETLDGGSATVDRVIFRACDGDSWVDHTDVSFDPVSGASWSFPAGDWCAVDVVWSTDVELWGDNSQGDFTIVSTDSWTRLPLDPSPGSAPLLPFSVEEGTVPSGHPRLQVSVD